MKILVVVVLFCVAIGNANSWTASPFNEKEKDKKTSKKKESEDLVSRNFHSIKKWKITVEYNNGDTISRNIEISDDPSSSAMEHAFIKAEKYIKSLKKVKSYNVSPVSSNPYVLLAGGK